jgi:hypothetical protein
MLPFISVKSYPCLSKKSSSISSPVASSFSDSILFSLKKEESFFVVVSVPTSCNV